MPKDVADPILKDLLRVRQDLGRLPTRHEYFNRFGKFSIQAIIESEWKSWINLRGTACLYEPEEEPREPKILIFDIETAPIMAYVWSIWEQNVGLNQIAEDWHLMSWAAKWLNEDKVIYMDQRSAKDITNDKGILKALWDLLDNADIVIGQNIKKFDTKKVNARFVIHGMPPPSPYKMIDTVQLAKANFSFTSNKLEYLSDKLNKKHKKSKHAVFSGFELWRECMRGNKKAWQEMEHYNRQDVLATEELYKKLAPWGTPSVNINLFKGEAVFACPSCGSKNFKRAGFAYISSGKFQRFQCLERNCLSWFREQGSTRNFFSSKKKESLKGP